jgi:hypothetical protein
MDTASLICALMLIAGFWMWLADCRRDSALDRLQSSASAPPGPALIAARIQTRLVRVPELDGTRGTAQMELSTYASGQNQIVSFACIDFVRGGVTDYIFGGDFCKNLRQAEIRTTQENQDAQHASVFTPETIAAVKIEAMAFYANKHNRGTALERFFAWRP